MICITTIKNEPRRREFAIASLNKLKALIERVYDTYEQTWRQFAMTKQLLQKEKARERNARANEKRKEKRRQEQAQ